MPIRSIRVENMMVFQRQGNASAAFEMHFTDRINVLVGENGTGKTALLKMLYAAAQASCARPDAGHGDALLRLFSNHLENWEELRSPGCAGEDCGFVVSDGAHTYQYRLSQDAAADLGDWCGLDIRSVFIPSAEILSHSKGLLALYQKYGNLLFDDTQVDILVNASLPEAGEAPATLQPVLDRLSDAIDGEVVQENGVFYVRKRDGRMVAFSLETEGICMLGLL